MPPVPHGAAGAGRQVGGSEDGRARRAWVDSVGALSVTLATPLNGKKGEGLWIWPPLGGHCAGGGAGRRPCLLEEKGDPANPSVVERRAGPSVLVLWMFGCAVGDDAADVVGRYACAKCGQQQDG